LATLLQISYSPHTHTSSPTVALHPPETISFTLTTSQACSSETSEQPCNQSVCYNSEDYNFNNSCSEVLSVVIILDGIFKGIQYLVIHSLAKTQAMCNENTFVRFVRRVMSIFILMYFASCSVYLFPLPF